MMVFRFGFVPNGGRIYYLRRSQPPMLIPMVYEYYKETRDLKFILNIITDLHKEFKFWYRGDRYTFIYIYIFSLSN